jgi:MOSC domain-containing protein YiiM
VRHSLPMAHPQLASLESGLAGVRDAPNAQGRVELVVRRPAEEQREILAEASLDTTVGLVGDRWSQDASPHADRQLTLMNARVAALVAQEPERWQLAGDQLFVDFDLSLENVPPGTRLRIGTAVVEVTSEPHRGCGKFASRFGVDALKFVNSKAGRELNLRGLNAKVVENGVVRPGDDIVRL